MAVHHLKCHPEPFDAIRAGLKTYELRRDDRGYAVGDTLHLRRWCPVDLDYTGESIRVRVTHLTRGPEWGLSDGWVCMAVRRAEGRDWIGERNGPERTRATAVRGP